MHRRRVRHSSRALRVYRFCIVRARRDNLIRIPRHIYSPALGAMTAGHAYLSVIGRVVRVRSRDDGGWRVRLSDTGGALAAAEFRRSNPLPLPRVGACIIVRGRLRFDEEHAWYVVDPVEEWLEARTTAWSVESGLQ